MQLQDRAMHYSASRDKNVRIAHFRFLEHENLRINLQQEAEQSQSWPRDAPYTGCAKKRGHSVI